MRVRARAALVLVCWLGSSAAASAESLEYIERLSGDAATGAELPLVIAVHGLGDRPERFAVLFEGFDQPARFIYPRAPIPWGTGYSWFPIHGIAGATQADFVSGLERSARLLAELIEEITSSKPTRGKPIVTGFSQGGMLSFALAARHGESIGLALPISGLLPSEIKPTQLRDDGSSARQRAGLPRILAFHGSDDARVPIAAAEQAVERLREAGFDAELRRYAKVGHSISAAMRTDLAAAIGQAIATESSRTSEWRPPSGWNRKRWLASATVD